MFKKHISIMLIAALLLSLFPQFVFAERILPEKTNALADHNPERGLNWLSDQSLLEKIVASAKESYRGDENLLALARESIIISTAKTYGYINGYRADVSEKKNVYPVVLNDIMYVPLKFAGLSVSGEATYNEAENLATVTHGSSTASVPTVEDNQTIYLPVRQTYEALGFEVIYSGKGTVIITSKSNKALVTEDILLKVSDSDFYIERDKIVHPSSAIRWIIHTSETRGFATANASSVKKEMESYLSGTSLPSLYISDKSLENKYPEGSRSFSNLLTMSYYNLADFVDYASMYYTYTQNNANLKRARHIGERASYERAAGYFARLYELNPKENEDLALRTIIMLYHTALRFDELDTSYNNDNSFYNYAYVTPHYLVYAYDKVYHSPMWEAFKAGYGTDAKAVVEKYFRTIYNYICANYKGSQTISNYPLIMEHTAGLGIALDDPDIIRFAMERLNASVNPLHFYADGMWYEGSVDYGSQMVGHAYGAARIIKEYRDRRCYTDDIFGVNIKLDGKQDTKNRWTKFFDYVSALKVDSSFSDTAFAYPDGSPLAINDVHWQKSSSNVANNTIKVNDFSKNIEMNHFGLYGLRYGDKNEAQQLNLSVQATTGVSHQHSGHLAMSYYSGGMELFPDIGYQTSGSLRYMSTAAYSHNTATAFEPTGKSSTDVGAFWARPNVLAYDDGSSNGKQIQLIEGSNLMPDTVTTNFANDYGVDVNRRMLLMIATGENTSYAVDVHRIKGEQQARESYLLSSQDEDTSLITNLAGLESYNGKLVDWLYNEKGKRGGSLLSANTSYSGMLVNPQAVITSDDISFTWQGNTASVNVFAKGNENSIIAFSQMPSVRRRETESGAMAKHFYRRVDVSENEVTTFASVYEGVKSGLDAKIKSVTWLYTGNDMTTSLLVEHTSGNKDYIYISGDTTLRNVGSYQMSGAVCILRTDSSGNVIYSYIYGDGEIKVRNPSKSILKGKSDVTYSVTAAQGSRFAETGAPNELTLSGTIPEYAKDFWGRVDFADGSGTAFRVEAINGNTISLNNDPGFYMNGENAVFTSYPMYEDTSKPGRVAEWAGPIPKEGTVVQRTRTDVSFTIKTPSFVKAQ